jgi:hypothetical protein
VEYNVPEETLLQSPAAVKRYPGSLPRGVASGVGIGAEGSVFQVILSTKTLR